MCFFVYGFHPVCLCFPMAPWGMQYVCYSVISGIKFFSVIPVKLVPGLNREEDSGVFFDTLMNSVSPLRCAGNDGYRKP